MLRFLFWSPLLLSLLVLVQPSAAVSQDKLSLDDVFPTDRIIQVHIYVNQRDWDTIRNQTRTFYTALQASRKTSPPPSPYSYVNATVVIDGVQFPNVAIRKKGFIGSQSNTRPSLKIKLNSNDKKANIGGLKVLTFNNNKQDRTQLSQYMGYRFYNAAGSPAPRCSLAKVFVNGTNLGIYSHVESAKQTLVQRGFGNDDGTFYEGTVVDFVEGWDHSFEHKFGDDKSGRKKISSLIHAIRGPEGEELVSESTVRKVFVPQNDELGLKWTQPSFDDSKWRAGLGGAGFEVSEGFEKFIGKEFDLKEMLHRKGTSAYMRFKFDVADLNEIKKSKLFLQMRYDDGFVAYLNGVQVHAVNVPDKISWDSKANGNHGDSSAIKFESFDISPFAKHLKQTGNVLAIHGMNTEDYSSDMLFDAKMVFSDYDEMSEIFRYVERDSFYRFWAIESLLGFWDGYAGNRNNFFFYVNPTTDKIHFLPWGADSLFTKSSPLDRDPNLPVSVKTNGIITHRIYQHKEGKERYKQVLLDLLDNFWNEEELVDEVLRMEELIRPHLEETQRSQFSTLSLQQFIEQRRGDILEEIKGGMPDWNRQPGDLPLLR